MNAQELRIGNYIYDEKLCCQKICEITDFNRVCLGYNRVVEDLQNCTFIPLTEDWLLINGFKKKRDTLLGYDEYKYDTGKYHITAQCVYTNFRKWAIHIDDCDFCSIGSGEVDYVHQLQNLVFDITGEEL